jgi:hypothetical protein
MPLGTHTTVTTWVHFFFWGETRHGFIDQLLW